MTKWFLRDWMAPQRIAIDGPSPHSPFTWNQVTTATLAPRAGLDVVMDFSPPGIGHAQGTLVVQSNAADSPQRVPLQGTGVKGNPL